MAKVFGVLALPGGSDPRPLTVAARLVTGDLDGAGWTSDRETIVGRTTVGVGVDGAWELDLAPNQPGPADAVTVPTGSVWELVFGGVIQVHILVPGTAPPAEGWWVGDIVTDPPGALATTALAVHAGLTTTAHGGLVATTDPRVTDVDAIATVGSRRTLGTGALQAAQGTHVADATAHGGIDAVATTGSRRTLGTGALQASAGTHGHVLASTVLAPATLTGYSVSSTTLVTVTAALQVTFTVPASGAVTVGLTGTVLASSYPSWGLRDSAGPIAGSRRRVGHTSLWGSGAYRHRATGLTPGASLTWWWAHCSATGAATTLYVDSGDPAVDSLGVALMEATAA